jgi:hypothetical protein
LLRNLHRRKKKNFIIYFYDLIVKQKIYKRPTNHYSHPHRLVAHMSGATDLRRKTAAVFRFGWARGNRFRNDSHCCVSPERPLITPVLEVDVMRRHIHACS